jgi:hypothetical protein
MYTRVRTAEERTGSFYQLREKVDGDFRSIARLLGNRVPLDVRIVTN